MKYDSITFTLFNISVQVNFNSFDYFSSCAIYELLIYKYTDREKACCPAFEDSDTSPSNYYCFIWVKFNYLDFRLISPVKFSIKESSKCSNSEINSSIIIFWKTKGNKWLIILVSMQFYHWHIHWSCHYIHYDIKTREIR